MWKNRDLTNQRVWVNTTRGAQSFVVGTHWTTGKLEGQDKNGAHIAAHERDLIAWEIDMDHAIMRVPEKILAEVSLSLQGQIRLDLDWGGEDGEPPYIWTAGTHTGVANTLQEGMRLADECLASKPKNRAAKS